MRCDYPYTYKVKNQSTTGDLTTTASLVGFMVGSCRLHGGNGSDTDDVNVVSCFFPPPLPPPKKNNKLRLTPLHNI